MSFKTPILLIACCSYLFFILLAAPLPISSTERATADGYEYVSTGLSHDGLYQDWKCVVDGCLGEARSPNGNRHALTLLRQHGHLPVEAVTPPTEVESTGPSPIGGEIPTDEHVFAGGYEYVSTGLSHDGLFQAWQCTYTNCQGTAESSIGSRRGLTIIRPHFHRPMMSAFKAEDAQEASRGAVVPGLSIKSAGTAECNEDIAHYVCYFPVNGKVRAPRSDSTKRKGSSGPKTLVHNIKIGDVLDYTSPGGQTLQGKVVELPASGKVKLQFASTRGARSQLIDLVELAGQNPDKFETSESAPPTKKRCAVKKGTNTPKNTDGDDNALASSSMDVATSNDSPACPPSLTPASFKKASTTSPADDTAMEVHDLQDPMECAADSFQDEDDYVEDEDNIEIDEDEDAEAGTKTKSCYSGHVQRVRVPKTLVPQPVDDINRAKYPLYAAFLDTKDALFPDAVGSRSHHVYGLYDPKVDNIVYIGTTGHSLETRQAYRDSGVLKGLTILPLFLKNINYKSGTELERFLICYAALHLKMPLLNRDLHAPDKYELKQMLTFPTTDLNAQVKAVLDYAIEQYKGDAEFAERNEFITYPCDRCPKSFKIAAELTFHLRNDHGLTSNQIEALAANEGDVADTPAGNYYMGVQMVRVPRSFVPQPAEDTDPNKTPAHRAFLRRNTQIFPDAVGSRSHHVYVLYDSEKDAIVYIGTTGHSLHVRQLYRNNPNEGPYYNYLKRLHILPLLLRDIHFASGTEWEKFLINYAVTVLGMELYNEDLTPPDKAELKVLLDNPTDELTVEVKALFKYAMDAYKNDTTFAENNEFIEYKCESCGNLFVSPDSRNQHMIESHGAPQMFYCDLCPAKFKRERNLDRHMQEQHLNPRMWPCDFEGCTAEYKSERALNSHKERIHINPQTWPCDVEGCTVEPYKDRSSLDRHKQRVHGTPQTWPCDVEGCTVDPYKDKSSLDRHKQEKHGTPPEFRCPYCSIDPFTRKYNLNRHIGRRHPGQPCV